MTRTLAFLACLGLVVAGVGMVSVPAALITAGLLGGALVVLDERAAAREDDRAKAEAARREAASR